jgi:hypothetical protein
MLNAAAGRVRPGEVIQILTRRLRHHIRYNGRPIFNRPQVANLPHKKSKLLGWEFD